MFDSQEEKMQALLQQQRQQSLHANVLQTLSPQQLELLINVTSNGGLSASNNSEPSLACAQRLRTATRREQILRAATCPSQQDPSDSPSLQDMESQLQRAQRALSAQGSQPRPPTSLTGLGTLDLVEFTGIQNQLKEAHPYPPNGPIQNQLLGQLNSRRNRSLTSVSESLAFNRQLEAPSPTHIPTLQQKLSQMGEMLGALQQQQQQTQEQLLPDTVAKLFELRQQIDTILLHGQGRNIGPSPEWQGAEQPRGQGEDWSHRKLLDDSCSAHQKVLLHLLGGAERQSHDSSDALGSLLAERNTHRNSLGQQYKESCKAQLPPTMGQEGGSSAVASGQTLFRSLNEELMSRHESYTKSTFLKNQVNSQLESSGHLNNIPGRKPTSHNLQVEDSLRYSNNGVEVDAADHKLLDDSNSITMTRQQIMSTKDRTTSTSTCSSSQPSAFSPDCTASDLIAYIYDKIPECLSLEFLIFCKEKSQDHHQGFYEILEAVLNRLHIVVENSDNVHLCSRASECILEIESIIKGINLSSPDPPKPSPQKKASDQVEEKLNVNSSSTPMSSSSTVPLSKPPVASHLQKPLQLLAAVSTPSALLQETLPTLHDNEVKIVKTRTPPLLPAGLGHKALGRRPRSPSPLCPNPDQGQSSMPYAALAPPAAAEHNGGQPIRPPLPCTQPQLKRPRDQPSRIQPSPNKGKKSSQPCPMLAEHAIIHREDGFGLEEPPVSQSSARGGKYQKILPKNAGDDSTTALPAGKRALQPASGPGGGESAFTDKACPRTMGGETNMETPKLIEHLLQAAVMSNKI
mmetsp:Transcript_38080/g.88619  ORF Transcript_38080/g.88619 Transcript_38080/m.88619 type:complete len:800 (-) Transcript_38080:280-2679(-)